MKKICVFLMVFLAISCSCLAFTPDNNWQLVATDKDGVQLYVRKTDMAVVPLQNGETGITAFSLALAPNNQGSYYRDILLEDKDLGKVIRHVLAWSFYENEKGLNFLTESWVEPNKRIWFSTKDEFFKAEYDYVEKQAKVLNLK